VLRAGAAIFALLVTGLVALLVAAHVAGIDPSQVHAVPAPRVTAPTPTPSPLSDLGRAVLGSVVTVEVELTNEESLGTGWIFDAKGDVVTNAHVIEDHAAIRITDRQNHTQQAVVLGAEYDMTADIALLRPVAPFPGTPLPVAAAALRTTPVSVIALASSTATGKADMTEETLVGLDADVPLAANGGVQQGQAGPQVYHHMLRLVGTRIFEGNSGGPVLDGAGQVVGILTLASPSAPDAYAIPIDRVIAQLTAWSHSG
jgi:S1-C subfamily serine protease